MPCFVTNVFNCFLNVNVSFSILSIFSNVNSEFPIDLKPCKYGDVACIRATINTILKDKSQGDASINLLQLIPLKLHSVHLQPVEESPVSLDLILTNNYMYGLETAHIVKVRGFGKDLTKSHSLHLHAHYLSTAGDYDVNGKILILPIKGSGKSNITMVDVDVFLNFEGVPVERDGATYMHIENLNVDAEPKNMIYKVENLFNGDKALGDNMNLFLNENWKEIYNEVRDSLSKAYSQVFMNVINKVFSQHPYDKYFTE